MTHPRLALVALLALALPGCLAAAAAPEAPSARAETHGEAPPPPQHGHTPTVPEATDDGTPEDEPLRVSWFPESPEPGDTVRVRIETAIRWPEPTCHVEQRTASSRGGGESSIGPATEHDDEYACHVAVGSDTASIVLLVTRPHGELLRVHGPHVIDVRTPEPPLRESFVRFALDASAEGLPRVRGEVPTTLANVGVPQLGPAYGSNSTSAWLSLSLFPAGHGLIAGFGDHVAWTSPLAFENVVDVPAFVADMEREFSDDYPEHDYVLIAHAFARGDIAFATSEPRIMGFGACAVQMCYVIDG